eukprot:COSAG02_NODE_6444_length_3565_cov_2.941143_2_plen_81_part_00
MLLPETASNVRERTKLLVPAEGADRKRQRGDAGRETPASKKQRHQTKKRDDDDIAYTRLLPRKRQVSAPWILFTIVHSLC